ncbi:DUF5801 repeats-in-toxin domain-containing protein [Sphingopyxis sp.]|uniref:DUF5801 repeats-in-toxin domain-containing protein n=1 Tax=Sphingopyxis sp. TaxID=1908224 RepID=UPI0039C91D3B
MTIDVLANDVEGADSVQPGAVELVAGSLTGTGTLVNNGDGSFTYTPGAQETGSISFQYRVTDGDGDTDVATATITLVADSAPQIGKIADVTVDEDGLVGANADNGLSGEVTSTGSASANGTIIVDFGSDVPATLAGSLVLDDSAALDTHLTVNNVPVTFEKVGNDLVGSVGGNEVIRISLTAPAAGPGATQVTYGYTVTLSQAIDQAVPGSEDSDFLAGIGFTVTDNDGTTASGAFGVTIVDDLPTLNVSDAPTTVVEGATANGTWTLDRGADGVSSVNVSFGSGSATLSLAPGSSVSITEPTGTLTVNADGTFSFAAVGNQNNAANPSATFTLSAVDRDGDPTSDSLTIAIADGAIPANAAPITLTVNEAALANGSTPPSPDEVASGDMIFTAGSDTLSGFAFTGVAGLVASLDGAGTDIYWTMAPGGQTITGSLTPDGPAAITISLTAPASIAPGATGTATVTVTLAGNLPHALAMAAQTQPLGTVTVQATDTDGDPATGVVTVQVTDDVPAVTAAAGGANALTVDDSDLATNATANFGFGQPGSLFDVAFNADGPAAVNSIVYALGVKSTGIASGLVDTITGQSVVLTNEAGVVYGRTSGSGAVVFTLTVDANGTVTLDQQRPVFHSPDTGADQAIGLSAADLITLTATVTDSDGDPASATANIGGSLTFKDDGVNIDIAVVSEANVLLTTQDGETIGAASDFAVSTANFSDAFAFANADFGEDGAGSITWNYLLSLFGADGADSGLDSNGFSIFLYNVSGVITGSTAANAGAVNPGNTVFTLDANAASGTVTLTQFAQIDHDGPGVDSNFENQLAMLADNLVRLTGTVTITDRDGDTDSATQSIDLGGNIRFADDGPVLDVTLKAGAELLIDETNGVTAAGTEVDPDATGNLGSATIAIADLYTVSLDAGADTPVSYSYAFVLGGANPESGYLISATNEVIRLYQASLGTVEGRGETSGDVAFTFTVAANGTVTMTQLIAIEHGNTASNDESSPGMNAGALLLQVTATDFDGDFSSDTVDLGSVVRIEDDGPSITNVAGSGIVTLDETGGFDTVTSADPVITAAFAYGADGPASTGATTYGIELTTSDPELDPAAVDSGLKTAVGDFAVMLVETSATTIAGRYTDGGGTHDAFTITIGSDGKLTVTQLVALEHLQDGELALHNDALTLTGLISATVTIKDGDNDTATAKTEIGDQITFLDDGLTANADIKSIIEGAVATGNVLTDNADSFGTDGAEATSPAGGVVGVRAAGGDMTTPVTTGTGTVISTALGDLTLNADGSYSYDAKPNTTSTIVTDVFVYTIRDADGDTSTTTLTITIQPVTLAPDNQTKTVDEAGLDLNQDGDDVAEGTVTGSNPGATTETVTGTLGVTGTGVTYTPQTVEDALGKFVLNANGTYTYTLKSAFDGATLDNDITTENGVRVFNYTATDANGNSVPGTITINVIDDIPTARADTDAVAEDSGLPATGNVVTGVGTTNAPGSADTQGADGAAVTGVAAGTPAGDVTGNIGVAVAGSYGSLTLDAIGGYTYTLNNGNATVQALGVNESLTETYTYTLTDGDGDRTTTTLTITINGVNDAPTVTNNAVWMSSDPAQQTATTPTFANGYPLNVVVPTDVDGDPLVVTASNAPTGVFYFNGTSYVALTTGTILFDTDAGINLLDDLVYRPTATANDTVDVTLNLGVSDGTTSVTQSVFIHEVAPTRLPGQNAQIGDGSSPLTSGNDQEVTLTLTPEFAAGLNGNANIAVLELFTDFQKSPFDSPIPVNERDPNGFGGGSAGSKREEEVTVEITIDGNRFVVVQDDDTAAQFEQTWLYDSASGLMKATVPYTSIFLLDGSGNPTGTTLADYLTANPPVGGDTWELTYLDDDGGSFQARLVRFEFKYNDAGNPAITVNGDPVLADTIYGTSGNDTLNGNGGNDIIYGRGGNDVINGGDGDDTLFGNDGNDTITGGPGTDAIDGGSGTNTITPPVVLDLDGDGLEFVDTSAGVRFDFDGDGIAEATAWTAPDDGLLVYDVNGDRQVSGASELVLANYADGATTDLDALRLAFDTNGDGQFTAADAEFASFGAWQDINSNGVADAGEYHTLTELGITAIDLHSDGQSYRAASGEVLVFGQSNFTRADGSRGTVGDVSFATRQADGAQRAVDQSSNQALASSLVAASLIVGIHDAQPDSVASPIAVTRAEPGIDQADGGVAAAAVDASALATPSSAANDSLAETPKTAAPDTSTPHSDETSPAAIDGAEDSGWRSEATDNADTGNPDSLADMIADRGSFDPGVMDGLLALAAVPAEAVAAGSDAAAHDPAAIAVLAEVLESGGSTVDQLIHAVTGGPEPVQIAAGETPAFDLAQFLDQQIAPDVAFPTSQALEADLHAMAAA